MFEDKNAKQDEGKMCVSDGHDETLSYADARDAMKKIETWKLEDERREYLREQAEREERNKKIAIAVCVIFVALIIISGLISISL